MKLYTTCKERILHQCEYPVSQCCLTTFFLASDAWSTAASWDSAYDASSYLVVQVVSKPRSSSCFRESSFLFLVVPGHGETRLPSTLSRHMLPTLMLYEAMNGHNSDQSLEPMGQCSLCFDPTNQSLWQLHSFRRSNVAFCKLSVDYRKQSTANACMIWTNHAVFNHSSEEALNQQDLSQIRLDKQ